jgi:pilus assembly protein CpaE
MNFPGLSKMKELRPSGRNELHSSESIKCNIGILGAKGGVGTTTIAVNLAYSLSKTARSGANVTLIDCNLQQPDCALMLSCQPEHSIVELFLRSAHLDIRTVEACCLPFDFSSEMRLITSPIDGSAGSSYSLTDIANCLPTISEFSSLNILDIPNRLDKHLVTLLDICNLIILVIEPNMTSIAAGKRWLKNFAELGYHDQDLMVVVNRVGGKLKYIEQQTNKSFPGVDLLNLPSVYSQAENCAIEGLPLVHKSPKDSYSKAIQVLATSIRERILIDETRAAENFKLQTVKA